MISIPIEIGCYWALEIMSDELGYQTYLHVILVDRNSLKEEKCLVLGDREKQSLRNFNYFVGPITFPNFPIPEFSEMKEQLSRTGRHVYVEEPE